MAMKTAILIVPADCELQLPSSFPIIRNPKSQIRNRVSR